MVIKFLGNTLSQYKGADGKGGVLDMKKGDTAEVGDVVGQLLCRIYGRDFKVVVEEKPAHAPSTDKQAKKSAQFKSK